MVLPRGGRGGYHSRGGSSRGGVRSSYHGSGSYHSSHHNSSYDNRNDSRNNRYSSSSTGGAGGAGGGGAYDSRNSSRYESDSRYSRHDSRNDTYKRTNSSKYEDNRDRRSPDRKRPRNEHNSQGGSSRRDYGGSSSSVVGGRGGGSSSSRYHEGGSSGSSYDKRGSHDHHSSTTGGAGDASSGRSKFEHHRSSSSASRSHGGADTGSSYRSRDNNSSSMGPPRSVAMRTSGSSGAVSGNGRSMMRPSMGGSSRMLGGMGGGSSSSLGGGMGGGMHRRGGGSMRGRISHYRSDGRRGMLNSRILGGAHHRRNDIRPIPMHNRRFPSIRGRGDIRHRILGNIGQKRPLEVNSKVSRKSLIKRAIQAAKDVHEDSVSENDDDDEEDEGVDDDVEAPSSKKMKRATEESSPEEKGVKSKKEDTGDDKHQENSSVKIKREEEEDDDEEDADTTGATVDEEDESSKQETPVKKSKIPKKETLSAEKTDEKRKDEASDKKRSTKITTKYRSSSFIKLTCTHCNLKCVTFKEYQTHLYSRGHKMKMRTLAIKCRERLLEMRAAQRNAQKDEDEKSEDGADGEEGSGKQRAGFCTLCRLNYRQPRATHQLSEGHKEMKNFLMPYCNVCKIGFKSPMAYETHRASLDHLKIKARVERYASSSKGDDSGDELTGDLVDLDSLTIVDEVGKVDEICEPGVKKETDGSTSAGTVKREYPGARRSAGTEDDDDDDEDEDDAELQMIIGEEYVQKVEVQYCELCDMYLHRRLDTQKTLREHCKKPGHLRLYISFRNDKKLREQAERIHKKKLKDKEAVKTKKVDEKKQKESSITTDTKSAAAASSENVTTSTSSTAASTSTAAGGGDGGTTPSAENNANESSGNSKSAPSKGSTPTAVSTGASQPVAKDEQPVPTGPSTDESLSLDASKDADTASLGGDVNTTLIDDKLMWQVVDNDELGDLLRDVNEAEEEDDDKASLERYDKFRHTEKNGLEALVAGGAGDEEEDSADVGGSKPSGQVKTTTNGDTANVDAGKEAKVVDA